MTNVDLDEFFNKYVPPIRDALGLGEWKVTLTFGHCGPNAGTCTADSRYKRAQIQLDPDAHENETKLLDTLVHELLHIVHAEYEVYRRAVAQLTSDKEFNAVDEIYEAANESLVFRLEQMLKAIGLTPRKLARKGGRE